MSEDWRSLPRALAKRFAAGGSERTDLRVAPRTAAALAGLLSPLISVLVTALIAGGLVVITPQLEHWFVLPVSACGALIGIDAVDWARGRRNLLDPGGIAGVFGYHFFFLAPVLQVGWDFSLQYVIPPADWRPWLGFLALLNLGGLVAYRLIRPRVARISWSRLRRWRLRPARFTRLAIPALLVMGGAQLLVIAHFGGVQGFIHEYATNRSHPFPGLGWVFALTEAFPILALMLFVVRARGKSWAADYRVLAIVLVAFVGLTVIFGGLRGARSATVIQLAVALGLIHIWLRPIPRKLVVAGGVGLIVLVYAYGFYKEPVPAATGRLDSTGAPTEIANPPQRTIQRVVIDDLGRADVQAFLLYRLSTFPDAYDLAKGETYMGDLASLIPRRLGLPRPPSKVQRGTEAEHGEGSFQPWNFASSDVYGLSGEAILNFGRWAPICALAAWGVLLGWLAAFCGGLGTEDSRRLLVPYLSVVGLVVLIGDLDNVALSVISNLAVPGLIVLGSSSVSRTGARRERSRLSL